MVDRAKKCFLLYFYYYYYFNIHYVKQYVLFMCNMFDELMYFTCIWCYVPLGLITFYALLIICVDNLTHILNLYSNLYGNIVSYVRLVEK